MDCGNVGMNQCGAMPQQYLGGMQMPMPQQYFANPQLQVPQQQLVPQGFVAQGYPQQGIPQQGYPQQQLGGVPNQQMLQQPVLGGGPTTTTIAPGPIPTPIELPPTPGAAGAAQPVLVSYATPQPTTTANAAVLGGGPVTGAPVAAPTPMASRELRAAVLRPYDTGVDATGAGANDGVLDGAELQKFFATNQPSLLAELGLIGADQARTMASGPFTFGALKYNA